MQQIKYIDYGIGYSDGWNIELNIGLKKYPKLLGLVLEHELDHMSAKGFIENLMVDVKDMFFIRKQIAIFLFSITTPSSFFNMLPFWYKDKTLHYNPTMIIFYIVLLLFLFASFFLVCNIPR